ncbi:hypothetical protein [Burkholderia guangdongensis]|uniref:hypothetical protein n=1 Tax=Burkholderia guangdongensis TaxID=1792500 RepID=UPI001FEAD779|nr:hypothetical protein [Burkholderia guangdongensis]
MNAQRPVPDFAATRRHAMRATGNIALDVGLAIALCIGLLVVALGVACAQEQVANPGDIIVLRNVTPRIAYRPVPTSDDPVVVRATTFPANTFDPMMATMVSDLDLTNAHGSSGVAPDGVIGGGAGMQAITRVLTGDATGGAIVHGPLAGAGPAAGIGGIGGVVSGAVTNALSPVTSALGAIK